MDERGSVERTGRAVEREVALWKCRCDGKVSMKVHNSEGFHNVI